MCVGEEIGPVHDISEPTTHIATAGHFHVADKDASSGGDEFGYFARVEEGETTYWVLRCGIVGGGGGGGMVVDFVAKKDDCFAAVHA